LTSCKKTAYRIGITLLVLTCTAVRSHGEWRAGADRPKPDHVVVVIMENKSFSDIIDNPVAPYINSLAGSGALLSESYGVTHPSEPNYLALFSGSTQGIDDDSCPHTFTNSNLGSELLVAGLSFGIYCEAMPSIGFTGCVHGRYYRKHNPAVNWQGVNIPPATNMPFSSFLSDYSRLPTVSLVIPDIVNDMHDGSISTGDAWLKSNMDGYIKWARTNNSMLILTWDEGSSLFGLFRDNHISTIFIGDKVRTGVYSQRVEHYDVLGTILDFYGLPRIGKTVDAKPLSNIWKRPEPNP
jgi:phospholipase C